MKLLSIAEKIIFKKSKKVFLAEEVYQKQFPEISQKAILLENKVSRPQSFKRVVSEPTRLHFLFTGTISEEFGIFDVLLLFRKICSFYPESKLTIAGYCGNTATRKELYSEVQNSKNIELVGISEHVNHQEIETLIQKADFGLLAYQDLECFRGKIPTKLREYMAYQLPMIGKESHTWNPYITENQAGICFDWYSISEEKLQQELEKSFYTEPIDPTFLFWDSYNRIITETVLNYSKH